MEGIEGRETEVMPRDMADETIRREDEILRNLETVGTALEYLAEKVNMLSVQARLVNAPDIARKALFLYADLCGTLASFDHKRRIT